MRLIIITVLIIFALMVIVWKRARKGVYRPLSFIATGVCELMDRGFDGGFMIFNHESSEKFVQISKWIDSSGQGLELSFPLVAWSHEYESSLRDYCQANGLDLTTSSGSDGVAFIDINFGTNVVQATKSIEHILLNIFGIPQSDGYFVRLEGACA